MNCQKSMERRKAVSNLQAVLSGSSALPRRKESLYFSCQIAIGLSIALQLAFSVGTVPVFAEGDALTNNTLPLAQPEPSKLVQKIWSSLAVRHNSKQQRDKATSSSHFDKISSAGADNSQLKASHEAEDTSISNSVTSTAQIILDTPAAVAEPQTNSSTKTSVKNATADSKATIPALEADDPAANERGGNGDSKPIVVVRENSAPAIDKTANTNEKLVESVGACPGPESGKAGAVISSNSSLPKASEAISSKAIAVDKAEEKPFKIASALGMVSLPPGSVLNRVQSSDEGVMVVDNDEAQEVEETLKSEVLPLTDDGKMHAKSGARFPIVLSSQVNSKTAKEGDPIKARLKYDLKIGDRLIAQKGSIVNGHVNYVLHARTIMNSLLSPERWYRNSGCLGLSFDEIINDKGEHLPLTAQPSRQARIVKNKAEGRELGVNHNGQVVGPWSEQIKYKSIRIGLNLALAPAGVFSFGAMPVALGVLGAASPSFAFAKPVGLNVRHRRLKGFAWGFLSGVPGSFLIEDTTIKGQEAIVKPGDEFYAELVQEFTGEPASDAELMPGATTQVHGQVLKDPKKVKKKNNNVPPKQ